MLLLGCRSWHGARVWLLGCDFRLKGFVCEFLLLHMRDAWCLWDGTVRCSRCEVLPCISQQQLAGCVHACRGFPGSRVKHRASGAIPAAGSSSSRPWSSRAMPAQGDWWPQGWSHGQSGSKEVWGAQGSVVSSVAKSCRLSPLSACCPLAVGRHHQSHPDTIRK